MVGPRKIDPDTRIVTYVSRGMESMRGFDIFMKVAKRIYEKNPNVIFAVVGAERTAYGGDLKHIKEDSFKETLRRSNWSSSSNSDLRYVGILR